MKYVLIVSYLGRTESYVFYSDSDRQHFINAIGGSGIEFKKEDR